MTLLGKTMLNLDGAMACYRRSWAGGPDPQLRLDVIASRGDSVGGARVRVGRGMKLVENSPRRADNILGKLADGRFDHAARARTSRSDQRDAEPRRDAHGRRGDGCHLIGAVRCWRR